MHLIVTTLHNADVMHADGNSTQTAHILWWISRAPCCIACPPHDPLAVHGMKQDFVVPHHPRATDKEEAARAAAAMQRASVAEPPGRDSTCKAKAGSVA